MNKNSFVGHIILEIIIKLKTNKVVRL